METTGEWLECIVDDDYEIYSEYPYSIRRKGSDRIIKEFNDTKGYVECKLNSKQYKKHRIVALQFIDNDDPENKTQIDHINHNKADNHISNLRWVSHSENMRNRSGHFQHQYVFLDELPETAEPLDAYNGNEFDGLFIDYEQEKLYVFNGVKYRELFPQRSRGNIYYQTYDIEGNRRWLAHKVLFD